MKQTKRVAVGGMMCALAFGLNLIEMTIPLDIAIPGIKLGLANIVVLVALFRLSAADAIVINVIRVLLVGCMFGNLTSIAFALAGAVCSFVIMYVLKNTGMHIVTISISGALAHIAGQLLVGLILYPPKVILYYSLFLMTAALVTGALLGIVAEGVIHAIRKNDTYN